MTHEPKRGGERGPLLVLAGTISGSGYDYLPAFGPINLDAESRSTFRGLPFGRGDPAAAGLEGAHWAVVRIDDPAEVVETRSPDGTIAAVEFRTGVVLFNGSRRGALERLLQCGADPDRMSVRLALQEADGRADSGPYGIAIAGRFGVARTGPFGEAFADYGGAAIAGDRGKAVVEDCGIAVVDSAGVARVGIEGIAIARGSGAKAVGGYLCIAVAMAGAGSVEVGAHGRGVVLGPLREAVVGDRGIVAAKQAVNGVSRIRLGLGAVAILRWREPDNAEVAFCVARAGFDGIEPNQQYVFLNGALKLEQDLSDWQHEAIPEDATPSQLGAVVVAENGKMSDAGDDGLAIGDEGDVVKTGRQGIAISNGKRHGESTSGEGGLAIGDGRFKTVITGQGGAALATDRSHLQAGNEGIAIGVSSMTQAGAEGIAIALDSDGSISGGAGCLLVVWTGDAFFAFGRVGEGGIEADRLYLARDVVRAGHF